MHTHTQTHPHAHKRMHIHDTQHFARGLDSTCTVTQTHSSICTVCEIQEILPLHIIQGKSIHAHTHTRTHALFIARFINPCTTHDKAQEPAHFSLILVGGFHNGIFR